MGSDQQRRLIVNADDFGQSRGVNRGVVAAVTDGIVTSASLMVRWPAAAEAAAFARLHPELSVGLHFDLGEWALDDGRWVARYEVLSATTTTTVTAEMEHQLEIFEGLLGRPPTHLDSHQHVHRHEPVRGVARLAAARLRIPLREDDSPVRYHGAFYGQDEEGVTREEWISVDALAGAIAGLRRGTTELACHPGHIDDLESDYLAERSLEVAALCDPRARQAIVDGDIVLSSYHDVARRPAAGERYR